VGPDHQPRARRALREKVVKFTIEVIAESRRDAYRLLRSAARRVRDGRDKKGREINHVLGDTRIFIEEDLFLKPNRSTGDTQNEKQQK